MSTTQSATATRRTQSPKSITRSKPKKPPFAVTDEDRAAHPAAEVLYFDPAPKPLRVVRIDGCDWFSARDALLLAGVCLECPQHYVDVDEWRRERIICVNERGQEYVSESLLLSPLGLHELLCKLQGQGELPMRVWRWVKARIQEREEREAALAAPIDDTAETVEEAA